MEIKSISIGQIEQQLKRQSQIKNTDIAGESFASKLEQAMQPAAEAENVIKNEQTSLLTGEGSSIHSVVMAAEKADIALKLTMQIRTKVLDAYNEVMRMQI